MDVIPVLDVAHGRVVQARRGEREAYQPIVTPLSPTADPAQVAKGLYGVYPFRRIYIADLDGIAGRGRNAHLVPAISQALPHTEIWVDAGTASRGAARALLAAPVTTLVLGSESLENVATMMDVASEAPSRTVLSLDFSGDEYMGPSVLLDEPELWPARVIVMTLARVGSEEGPDLARISDVVKRSAGRKVYAAGGIRDVADLSAVRAAGAAGALVATALHGGKITAGDLRKIAGR